MSGDFTKDTKECCCHAANKTMHLFYCIEPPCYFSTSAASHHHHTPHTPHTPHTITTHLTPTDLSFPAPSHSNRVFLFQASHTSRYALGYVLAEGSKKIDQQFLGKLKGKHYQRHDIPRIQTILGCTCDNTKRQFSSKFYKKAYDNNKPSTVKAILKWVCVGVCGGCVGVCGGVWGVWGCVGVCGGVWGCVGVCGGVWGCVGGGGVGGVWGCVGVCGGVWGCVGVCGGVWGCVGVCGGVWGCVGVCGGVWGCVGVCGGVWGCVGVCGGVWGCVGVCGGVCAKTIQIIMFRQ